jgi:hypothetical protein
MSLLKPWRYLEARKRLEAERDELKNHVRNLIAERDELAGHLARINAERQEKRDELLWAPAGHFYSPIVDPASPFVEREILSSNNLVAELPELLMWDAPQWQLLVDFSDFYEAFPFGDSRLPGLRYFCDNPAFRRPDAFLLYGFIRQFQPKRIVEIGCGFSTCVIFDTVDLFLDFMPQIRCFDPFPDVLLGLTDADDPLRGSLEAIALQDVPTSVFEELEDSDILFIDSSHVAKTGSDVVDYLFRILPKLRSGVFVHIHDIPFPFGYPAGWIHGENRSWNEAYFVRAFLAYNSAFEITFFNAYMQRKYPSVFRNYAPACLEPGAAGSLWLRRI